MLLTLCRMQTYYYFEHELIVQAFAYAVVDYLNCSTLRI